MLSEPDSDTAAHQLFPLAGVTVGLELGGGWYLVMRSAHPLRKAGRALVSLILQKIIPQRYLVLQS